MALSYRFLKKRRRPTGWDALCEVMDGSVVIEGVTPEFDHDPSESDISSAMSSIVNNFQARRDRESLTCRVFDDVGPELREALFWLISKIRQYPNATYAQAETQWNNEWSYSLFTFEKLATHVQKRAGNVTWAQFKTYVINHLFEVLD